MNRNNYVISQHLLQEPRRIDDLPGQVFIAGMEPDPEPVQAELFIVPEPIELPPAEQAQLDREYNEIERRKRAKHLGLLY